MDVLEIMVWGNTLRAWSSAFVVMLGVLAVLRILQKSVGGEITRIVGKGEASRILQGLLDQSKLYFLMVVAIYLASLILNLSPLASSRRQQLMILALFLQVAIWGGWLISYWVDKSIREKRESDPASATGIGAIGFILRLGLWAAVLLLALDSMGFNITAVLAGLGVGGIAVALAVQNILSDLFASLTIVLDKPFVIGDHIVVGEFSGNVEHIGLKTTRLRSISGEQLIFPNSNLLQSRIQNHNRMQERRIVFSIGVVYQTSSERLREIPEIIREIIASHAMARFDRAHFKAYGDAGLVFEIAYFVLDPDYKNYMDLQQSINFAIFERFQKDNIQFAYPTHTVFLHNSPES